MHPKHQLFIDLYTAIGQDTYGNGALSYRQAGFSPRSADANVVRLLNRQQIKEGIESKLKERLKKVRINKDQYLVKLDDELKHCNSPATRARLLELIGKVHQFLKEETKTQIAIFNRQDMEADHDDFRQAQSDSGS